MVMKVYNINTVTMNLLYRLISVLFDMKFFKNSFFIAFLFFISTNLFSQTLVDITTSGGSGYSFTDTYRVINNNYNGFGDGMGWSANLYLPGEMGASNKLQSMRFMVDYATSTAPPPAETGISYTFTDVTIYLFHYGSNTQFTSLNRPDLVALSAVKVFEGDITFKAPDKGPVFCETNISFSTEFDYVAGNSLGVYIERTVPYLGTEFTSPYWGFKDDSNTAKQRHISNWKDGTVGSPLPAASCTDNSRKYRYAQVKFNETSQSNTCIPSCATTITYPSNPYCQTGTATPTKNDGTAGTYSCTVSSTGTLSDLVFSNTSTGVVDLAASKPGTYTVQFTVTADPTCKPTATLTINPSGSASTSVTSNGTICSGQNAVFTITGTAGNQVTYSGVVGSPASPVTLNGSGSATITVSGATTTQTITLNSASNGSCSTTLSGKTATVTVNSNGNSNTTVSGNGPICSGQDAVFTITGTSGDQVTYSGVVGNPASPVTLDGSGSATITVSGATSTQTITLNSASNGSCSSALSGKTATVTVNNNGNSNTTVSGNGPICSGLDAIFTITGTSGDQVTYSGVVGSPASPVTLDGSGSATITVSGATTTQTITLNSASNGSCSTTLSGKTATVTVNSNGNSNTTVSGNGPICSGLDAVFTITGTSGDQVTYSGVVGNPASPVTLDGSGSATITVSGATSTQTITLNSASNGSCSSALSGKTATVTVNNNGNSNTTVSGNGPICSGLDAVFTITGTSGDQVSYSGVVGSPASPVTLDGSGSATITVSGATSTQTITLNSASNGSCSSALSGKTATVTVNNNGNTNTTVSGNGPICSGLDAVFTITGTSGDQVTYSGVVGSPASPVTLDGSGSATITVSGATSTQTITLNSASNGSCSSALSGKTATVTVNNNGNSNTTVSGNGPICSGQDAVFTITGTSGDQVTYSGVVGSPASPVTLDGSGSAIITVSGATSTQTITLNSASNGSCSSVLLGKTITINVLSNTITSSVKTAISACGNADGEVNVLGSGSGTITWSGATPGSVSGALPYVIQNLAAGSYTITFNNGTCTATTNISLSDPGAPAVPYKITASGSTSFCPGNSITLTASPVSGTVNWTKDGVPFGNPDDNPITVSAAGTYAVTVTVAGCTSFANDTTINVVNLPNTPTGNATQEFCTSENAKISNLSANGTSVKWYNSASGGTEYSDLTLPLVDGQVYHASQTSLQGCESTSRLAVTVKINVNPTPSFVAHPDVTSCLNTEVTYNTENGKTNYVWNVPGVEGVDYTITAGGIGTTNHIVKLKWLKTGQKIVTVGYTAGTCASLVNATHTTIVNSAVVATFDNSAGAKTCSSTDVLYSTQSGNTNYTWTVTGVLDVDYKIIAGSLATTSNTVTLQWLTTGLNKTVTVNYTKAGCASDIITSTTNVTLTPNNPTTLNAAPEFCSLDNATIDDLQVNELTTIKWYDNLGAEILPLTSLINGKSYFAKQTVGGCESKTGLEVIPVINVSPSDATPTSPQNFCLIDNPKISDLSAPASGNITWYDSETAGTAFSNSSTSLVNGKSYWVENMSNEGCTSANRVEVVVNILNPVAPLMDMTKVYCTSAKKQLKDIVFTNGSSYIFYPFAGGSAVDQNTLLVTGDKYYVSNFDGTCESSKTLITINLNDGPTIPNLANQKLCGIDKPDLDLLETKLTSLPNGDVSWYLTQITPQVLPGNQPIATGAYWVSVTDGNGCVSIDRKSVDVVVDNGTPLVLNSNFHMCKDKQYTIADLSQAVVSPQGGEITWYPSDISTSIDNKFAPTDKVLLTTYYGTYKATPSECESNPKARLDINLIAFNGPTNMNLKTQAFCKTNTYEIDDLDSSPYSNATIAWFSDELSNNALAANQELSTSDFIIFASETKTVNNVTCVNPVKEPISITRFLPDFTTIATQPICNKSNGKIEVVNPDPSFVFEWSNSLDPTNIISRTSILKDVAEGDYILKINQAGCIVVSNQPLNLCKNAEIPQILTPTSTKGSNDSWVIGYSTKYPNVSISIFNRWGSEVFKSEKGYKDDWDGKSKSGDYLPTGTYYYIIDKGNGEDVESGYLEIII
jgi:gliding motility-associated-like protein